MLGIITDEFDEQIMEFEEKECNFDSANRIYDVGGGISYINERGYGQDNSATNNDLRYDTRTRCDKRKRESTNIDATDGNRRQSSTDTDGEYP